MRQIGLMKPAGAACNPLFIKVSYFVNLNQLFILNFIVLGIFLDTILDHLASLFARTSLPTGNRRGGHDFYRSCLPALRVSTIDERDRGPWRSGIHVGEILDLYRWLGSAFNFDQDSGCGLRSLLHGIFRCVDNRPSGKRS